MIAQMFLTLPLLLGQNPSKPGDAMIEKYLAAETDKLSQKFLDGARTLDEWQAKRPRLHQEYLYMLGLAPLPEKTPLKATITGSLERDGVVIDKLHFQSVPGLYVTANLYRPKNPPEKKLPAVLYVCGHSNKGRDGNKAAFYDHGMWFASNGYICLIVDTLQLGEIPGVHHGTYGRPWLHLKSYETSDKLPDDVPETRFWWHSAGYTPAGVECWNGIRGIDYLISRPDVDAERIAVTGISGGGAATFWIAAADERVRCAVPVSGMSDLESYVKNKVINGHCDCMFLHNTFQWDWTTIAALVAPRPLLFANSDNDKIFPMDGNRRVIEKLRQVYKMYGKPELVDDYVSEGGHAYRPDLRLAIFKFINKHIKGDTGPVEDSAKLKEFAKGELRVFPDGDFPKDAINDRIDETFVPRAKVELPDKTTFTAWRDEKIKELRLHCFRNIPEKVPAAKRVFGNQLIGVRETEPGIEIYSSSDGAFTLGVEKWSRVILNDELETRSDWFKQRVGQGYIALTPRSGWTEKSPPNYVTRSHILLGRAIDEGRVYDILAYGQSGRPERIMGHGQAGILAAYAALFEPSIKEVVIIDPPKSHREGPHFLNVLRVLDIPNALGMLAPRKLTLINARDPAFDRVEQIYRSAGAADKLVRK